MGYRGAGALVLGDGRQLRLGRKLSCRYLLSREMRGCALVSSICTVNPSMKWENGGDQAVAYLVRHTLQCSRTLVQTPGSHLWGKT